MTGTPLILAGLLAECDACGIRLASAGNSGLEIEAPQDALTPDLLGRLKTYKAELLAMLRTAPATTKIDLSDAVNVWSAALRRLEGNPLFPPDLIEALRSAEVRWVDDPSPTPFGVTVNTAAKSTTPVCRCGSATWWDTPIHDKRSIRRDCRHCGRFLAFVRWY
jgi:hypothetical protein